jgi:acyl-coenzyme A thioesterase PaaI-like protein
VVMSTWTLPEGAEPVPRGPQAPAPGTELAPAWPRRFAAPVTESDLWGVRFYAGEGAGVTGEFVVGPELEGGPGVIHGGIMAAIFDELQGISGLVTDLSAVTAHLEIDYRKPIPIGAKVELDCEVLGRLRRKLYTRARALVDGHLVASSQGIFVVIDPAQHFKEGAPKTPGISP